MDNQVHVQDVVKVHLQALTSDSKIRKRLIITAGNMSWKEALEYLREKRPAIRYRLRDVSDVQLPPNHFDMDMRVTEEVTGLKRDSVKPWKEMILEVLDWVLDWEKTVKQPTFQGFRL